MRARFPYACYTYRQFSRLRQHTTLVTHPCTGIFFFNCFSKVYPETTLWIFGCDPTSVFVYWMSLKTKFLQEYWWFEHLPSTIARYPIAIEEYNFKLGIYNLSSPLITNTSVESLPTRYKPFCSAYNMYRYFSNL